MRSELNFLAIFLTLQLLLLSCGVLAIAQSPVPPGAVLERVATGFKQVEGPVWYKGPGLKGAPDSSLIFSDIAGNTMFDYSPETNGATPFMVPSDSSNGITFDRQGRLVFCQMGFRRVVRVDSDGTIVPLASMYNGKRFNSPNDVVVKTDGSIFFTDPPFNVPSGEKRELSFSGIFRIGASGNVDLLDSTLAYPNGICFSPDESRLYVNDSEVRIIYVWDVISDSLLQNKRIFARMQPAGYADGMKVDQKGNLFSAGPLGIWVFDSTGLCVDTILVPEQTSNCNWGDPDMKTLYITAAKSLYRIRLSGETGVRGAEGSLAIPGSELYPNFPNPFNPYTTISYRLSKYSYVRLTIFDSIGRVIVPVVSEHEPPGVYNVRFDAGQLSSGVYYYRLVADDATLVRKMLLIK